jgi:hypothetical protein
MAPSLTAESAEQPQCVPTKKVEETSAAKPTPVTEREKFFEDVHFLGDKNGNVVIRSPPVFENKLDQRKYQMQHLAAAYRVFAKQGFDEGTAGHISLRDPINPSMLSLHQE